MAKLYKNAIISPEDLFLNQVPPPPEEPVETVMPSIDEASLEQIRQEAYEQGYASGQTEERTRSENELSLLKKQLGDALAAIPNAVAQNRLDLTSEIADIVLLISQQFFIENQKDTKAINQQINQILSQLNNQQTVELCLHPQEIAALHQGAIQLDAAHLNGLKVKADESIALGGFIIKTNHGFFNVSIEKQIDKLKEVLLQLKQRGQNAPLD